VAGFDLVAWFMVYAPASLPAAARERLQNAWRQALALPEVRDKLLAQGVELHDMNPAEMAAFGSSEIDKWGEAVKRSGAQVD
jgi:tripartite-type tricarboxylate transporter receptor subunit TctC